MSDSERRAVQAPDSTAAPPDGSRQARATKGAGAVRAPNIPRPLALGRLTEARLRNLVSRDWTASLAQARAMTGATSFT